MSLAAYMWAADLPLNACSHTAFRVLLKYADRADELGYNAWHTEQHLAESLGCTDRTIRRARAELEAAGLIRRAPDRLPRGVRADRRPIVYDVMTAALTYHERHGGTCVSKSTSHGGTSDDRTGGQLVSVETALETPTKTYQRELTKSNRARAFGMDVL